MFEVPKAPDYEVPWKALHDRYEFIRALKDCPQDPQWHAEGDVWIHTKMVLEALVALPAWRALSEASREAVYTAAVLHDVAKPACTRDVNGRIGAPGHSRRGAQMARRLLFEAEYPVEVRERVARMILHHQAPFWALERERPERLVQRISQGARCRELGLLAQADATGRICQDQETVLGNVELFGELCQEQGCMDAPFEFPSEHTRFLYFKGAGRPANVKAFDDTRCEVFMLCGLPGTGKDTYIKKNLSEHPCVSLDALRGRMKIDPKGDQGRVIAAAREEARVLLREARTFVYNATNLSRQIRSQWIELFTAYKAKVRLIYLEVPQSRLFSQNKSRDAVVPEAVIWRMVNKLEPPTPDEAHSVQWCVGSA